MPLWTLKNTKILVVDDYAEMRSMLRGMLMAYGAEDIKQAANGEDAIELMANNTFDIILCDYNLGEGKDGQQVLEEAKHREILPLSTTFIMVTAENTAIMVMGALDYQPDAYLSKPVTKITLQTRLKKILDKKAFTKEISTAIDKKEFGQASKLCDEAMTDHPALRLELQSLQYTLLTTIGDDDAAETLCKQVLQDRDVPWAQLGLAKVYFSQQKYSETKALLDEIIANNSDFVAAFDLLSKTQIKLGDSQGAEETLAKAIKKSPKSLVRQRELGELAVLNDNHIVAERARRDAMLIGKYSVLRQPDDYVKYSQTLVKNNKGKEALKIADRIKTAFKGNHDARLQAEICKSTVHQVLGDETKAEAAVDAALLLYQKYGPNFSSNAGIALAKNCLKYNKEEEADTIIKDVAKNNHENKAVLEEINQTYEEAGFAGKASEAIAAAVSEIADINNEGVRLINEGKISESIELFKKAAKAMPLNHTISLNTAQSYILLMKKEGASKQYVNEAMFYLDAVKNVDSAKKKYDELMKNCREFALQTGL